MAIRKTKLVLKNSSILNRPYTGTTLLAGEPIVNTAEGIVLFSGVSSSTAEWTPSGINSKANFFEVGSNLYDLKLRNKITKYEDIDGAGLNGKFLSGTTNGFTLADISDIEGVDTFTTNFTYNNNNVLTISRNLGESDLIAYLDQFSGLTITGNLDVQGNIINTTGNVTVDDDLTINGDTTITGDTTIEGVVYSDIYSGLTQPAVYYGDGTNLTGVSNIYVSGGSINYTDEAGTLLLDRYNTTPITITGFTNIYPNAFTYNDNTLTLNLNDGSTLDTSINSLTGISVTNLTNGRIVYVGSGGKLIDKAGFTYNETTNQMTVENIGTTGDVMIEGNLTILGTATTVSTSELYVEDKNIVLNYNPTGDTTSSSINAGFSIQDGSGINTNNVNYDVVRMEYLTGLTSTNIPDISEYITGIGYTNRGWITQLNDIVIRSTDVSDDGSNGDINGVRVLAEFDVLDGGQY